MAAVITNMLLPDAIQAINNGTQFGKLEGKTSHYGALNTFYKNTSDLIDADTLERLRKTPLGQQFVFPIFNKYDHTIITVRTCAFTTTSVGVTKKAVIRFHVSVDLDIVPADFDGNYVKYQQALQHKVTRAKIAIYTYLDTACATYLDANKDTAQVIGANTLYTGALGEYRQPTTLDFYTNFLPLLETMDLGGPYWDVMNTAAMADMTKLRYNGGGAAFDTNAIMAAAQINQVEYSNRILPGAGQHAIHYVGPVGSIGIINFIDYDYRESPDLTTLAPDEVIEVSDIELWNKMSDTVFPGWEWGVRQKIGCVAGEEKKNWFGKLSADFAIVSDFVSGSSGESPIKRISIMA